MKVDSVVLVDLSDQAPDFRRLAVQPGLGLLDRGGAHAAILRKWLGSYLAEPVWDGNIVKYELRTDAGERLVPQKIEPLSAADCKGGFRAELDILQQKLEAAPARTGTERALRHVMLDRLKKLNTEPQTTAAAGVFCKYLDSTGVWRLAWLWGYERKSSQPGRAAICRKPDCRTLAILSDDQRNCPRCGTKLRAPRTPVPLLAAMLLLALLAGGAGFWWTRPPELVTLGGRVVTAQGEKPIAGAWIHLTGTETQIQTDAEGRFHFEKLHPESAKLEITAAGFLGEKLTADLSQTGERTLKIPLRGSGVLRGQVLDQLHQTPVAEALVSLPQWGISTQTNNDGAFQIPDVPGGSVRIEISAEGFQTETLQKQIAAKSQVLKFELAGNGKLAGTVIDALTLGPVSQAAVFLLGTPLTTKTDAEGRFEIGGLSHGEAAIAVQAEGYLAEHMDRQLEGAEIIPIRVGLYGAGTLTGRLTAQADGKPLANAKVVLSDLNLSSATNERGEFGFQKIPPGEHALRTIMPGFAESEIKVHAQDDAEILEIALLGNALLKGIVTDAVQKKPLPGVDVRIAGTDLTAKTGEDGTFALAKIPAGKRAVQVIGRGYRQVELPQAFEPGREQTIQVELKSGTILSGKVQDAITKTPIPDVKVELAGTMQSAKTDAEGRFRFEDIPAGLLHLKVVANGYPDGEQDAELKTGEESVVEIGLTGDAVLTGTVVASEAEKPLKDVEVRIAGSSRKTNTNDKGEFRLENLPAGQTELKAQLQGFQPAAISRTLQPGEETRADIALSGAGVLIGSVFSEVGDPLPAAGILVVGTKGKTSPNEAGEFRLEGLTPGEADVSISAKGFHPEHKKAQVAAEKPISLGEINLKPLKINPVELAKDFEIPAPQGVIVTAGTAAVQPAAIIPRDDFRTRLQRVHAKTGDVQVSLLWDNINDIDLHVQAPSGEVIYFGHRNSRCGGELDVDMNAGFQTSDEPVENIYWPLGTAPRGKYRVLVHHFANHGAADPTEFRVAVKNGREVKYYTGKINPNDKVLVCEFERLTGPEAVPITGVAPDAPVIAVADSHSRSAVPMVGAEDGEDADNPKTPPVYNRTAEEAAAERLRLARSLIERNKTEAAQRWLDDIIQRYPQTRSAKRCHELLDQLSEGATVDTRVGDTIYLADLTPVEKNVAGELEPRGISIGGEPKKHSLWTRTSVPHPPATVEYALGQRYVRLSGAVGIEDSGKADRTRVSTLFQIVGDGKVLWTSETIRNPGKSQKFAVDVSGVNHLKILTDSNNLPSHYPVWIDPSLVEQSGAD